MSRSVAALTTLALVIGLGVVSAASAATPVPISDTVSGDVFVLNCGDFEVWDQFELNSSGKLFLDDAGNPLRIVQHVWGSDTLYNRDTGKSLFGTINAGEIVDFVNGQAIESGQIFHVVAVGEGAVMVDVGRLIVTFGDGITLKGRHPFFEGDTGALCAALS